MRPVLSYGLLVSVVVGITVGALPLLAGTAAAQGDAENNCLIAFCSAGAGGEGEGGDATARGGHGGRGGIATIHDVANAHADASSSVILDNITTGDAIAHEVNVNAEGAEDPVVVAVAGSFPNTGVDVVAPGGNAQSGTTGGNGLTADESGGAGGDDTARGGRDKGADDTGGDNVFIIGIGIFP